MQKDGAPSTSSFQASPADRKRSTSGWEMVETEPQNCVPLKRAMGNRIWYACN